MKTYLADSETLSQSSDTLRRQLADVKNQLEVCYCHSVVMCWNISHKDHQPVRRSNTSKTVGLYTMGGLTYHVPLTPGRLPAGHYHKTSNIIRIFKTIKLL